MATIRQVVVFATEARLCLRPLDETGLLFFFQSTVSKFERYASKLEMPDSSIIELFFRSVFERFISSFELFIGRSKSAAVDPGSR